MRHAALACLIGLSFSLAQAAPPASGQGSVLAADTFRLYVTPSGEIAEKDITAGVMAQGQGPALLQQSWINPFVDPLGSFTGKALSAPGVNKAYSTALGGSASGYTDGASWSGGLNAASVWFERFTIMGGTGTGQITLSVLLDGSLSVAGPTNADGKAGLASIGFNLLTTTTPFALFGSGYHPTDDGLAFACDPGEDCDYGNDLASVGSYYEHSFTASQVQQRVDATISFQYGVPFYVIGALEASSYAYQAGATATADFFHTARVSTVLAPPGAAVWLDSGAYAGFGLTAPVPEPASAWLMLLGAAGLAAARRRRR